MMKVGGIQMSVNGFGLSEAERGAKGLLPIGSEELCALTLPYYGFVIDAFGCDRCMVESNFPVDRISVSSNVFWNCMKRVATAKGLSAAQKTQLFSGTANRVYKLK